MSTMLPRVTVSVGLLSDTGGAELEEGAGVLSDTGGTELEEFNINLWFLYYNKILFCRK